MGDGMMNAYIKKKRKKLEKTADMR